jgi:hypothetical protein
MSEENVDNVRRVDMTFGKQTRMGMYADPEEALRAAGL